MFSLMAPQMYMLYDMWKIYHVVCHMYVSGAIHEHIVFHVAYHMFIDDVANVQVTCHVANLQHVMPSIDS